MAKDRSKKILNEIAALREDVLARLDRLENRLNEAGTSHPAQLPGLPPTDSGTVPGVAAARSPAHGQGTLGPLPAGELRVIVRPLRDLSLARAVETSLAGSEGVERATLRELRGDSATIDVKAGEGFSVAGALRRHLPVAFDVTESDDRSVTIALAQPGGPGEGGVAAPGAA